ncbi:MAG: hypothetical protein IKS34_00215, partial [Clostridia bacterium]|nr:hypothetical protein [Clostridia bacterium]
RHLTIRLTEDAKEYLMEGGYDPQFGARPLKRFVQQEVETRLAKSMLEEDFLPHTDLLIDAKDGVLTIRPVQSE